MSGRLWWVRHGPTHARGMVGWSDLPADLSDGAAIARLQAALPDAPVIASDLARARQTARALAAHRPRLPDDPALREMHFGDWELRGAAEIEAEDPARARAFWDDPAQVTPPGGESWAAMSARVRSTAEALARAHEDLIVVAHFGPILSLVQAARQVTGPEAFNQRLDNLGLTVTRLTPTGWVLERVNHRP